MPYDKPQMPKEPSINSREEMVAATNTVLRYLGDTDEAKDVLETLFAPIGRRRTCKTCNSVFSIKHVKPGERRCSDCR